MFPSWPTPLLSLHPGLLQLKTSRSPKAHQPTPQTHSSKIPSVHVAHVVHGPSACPDRVSLLGTTICTWDHTGSLRAFHCFFRATGAMEMDTRSSWSPYMVHPFRLEEYTGVVLQTFALRFSTALNPAETQPGICVLFVLDYRISRTSNKSSPTGTRDTRKSQRPYIVRWVETLSRRQVSTNEWDEARTGQ